MDNNETLATAAQHTPTYRETILIMRFSALGDVAMTVPIVKALALSRPESRIVFASRPFAAAFYSSLADNVSFMPIDLKAERYKGLTGLEHLYQDLAAQNPDCVIDLHDVLRTKYARMRFRIAGIRVSYIDKHRSDRKRLTSQGADKAGRIRTAFQNYLQAIEKAGYTISGLDIDSPALEQVIQPSADRLSDTAAALYKSMENASCIGIAPFAAHTGKIYPIEKMEQVITLVQQRHPEVKILLFGGGPRDKAVFDTWCSQYQNIQFASGECRGLHEELAIISRLRCMVSMDSANMHLASLVGTPVVSVWGATHPAAGFMGWGQSIGNAAQHNMACRPCSIYGNKPCRHENYPCLQNITPESIAGKISRFV